MAAHIQIGFERTLILDETPEDRIELYLRSRSTVFLTGKRTADIEQVHWNELFLFMETWYVAHGYVLTPEQVCDQVIPIATKIIHSSQ